jgi:hypothetical protein
MPREFLNFELTRERGMPWGEFCYLLVDELSKNVKIENKNLVKFF